MLYTTKLLDEFVRDTRDHRESWIDEQLKSGLEWMDEAIRAEDYRHLVHQCSVCHHDYSRGADAFLALDQDPVRAKQHYYLAARAGALCYRLLGAGFPHYRGRFLDDYNFKTMNINFSKAGILVNDKELTLAMTGEDTIEGLLVLGKHEEARRALPEDPKDPRLTGQVEQCLWAIAHGDQKTFDRSLQQRIGVLRRQGRHCPTILDSWGLALIQLARRRGMTCKLKVLELPWQLLDDTPAEAEGLLLPFETAIEKIIQKKTEGSITV